MTFGYHFRLKPVCYYRLRYSSISNNIHVCIYILVCRNDFRCISLSIPTVRDEFRTRFFVKNEIRKHSYTGAYRGRIISKMYSSYTQYIIRACAAISIAIGKLQKFSVYRLKNFKKTRKNHVQYLKNILKI